MRRSKMSKGRSQGMFTHHAKKVHKRNLLHFGGVMRGGIRL